MNWGQDWHWAIKLMATIAVNLVVISFMVWLLWFSRWAKPKFCGKCPSCKWSEAYEGERHCTGREE